MTVWLSMLPAPGDGSRSERHESAPGEPFELAANVAIIVVLVRRWYDLLPPGPGPSRGPWQEHAFYTLKVTPPSGEATG